MNRSEYMERPCGSTGVLSRSYSMMSAAITSSGASERDRRYRLGSRSCRTLTCPYPSTSNKLERVWTRCFMLLDRQGQEVGGDLGVDGGAVVEHVLAHVGQHEPTARQTPSVRGERRPIEVVSHLLVVEVGLAHEQVGARRCLHERVRPLGVPRVRDDLAAVLDPERIRRGAADVDHGEWRDGRRPDGRGPAIEQLDELDGKPLRGCRQTREEKLHGGLDAR